MWHTEVLDASFVTGAGTLGIVIGVLWDGRDLAQISQKAKFSYLKIDFSSNLIYNIYRKKEREKKKQNAFAYVV